jgi:hypothetical protein
MKTKDRDELLIRIDERLKGVEGKLKLVIPVVIIILLSEYDKFRPFFDNFVKTAFAN